ncbi:MAG: HAD family phosphatase [Spirochaetales bacterium]|jgi:phosphoglycolate phosphatase/pyrophosphatase PpaX|nr:HAD family phosphatase [Spirochaetales bacterium]
MKNSLKYKALIFDHDDTCVNSTAGLHYPAHVKALKLLRPEEKPVSLQTWFEKNFSPGFLPFLENELHFTEAELETAFLVWREALSTTIPDFYPGILPFMREYRMRGGRIAVVSHSDPEMIRRAYQAKAPDLMPEVIFGWDNDPEKRKPAPYPALQALAQFNLPPQEVLVLDDLLPGIEMAQRAGIPGAAAGWGHQVPLIREAMEKICLRYFRTFEEFEDFLLT